MGFIGASVASLSYQLSVSVPGPIPTPARVAFGIALKDFPCVILEAMYALSEVWGQDYTSLRMYSARTSKAHRYAVVMLE